MNTIFIKLNKSSMQYAFLWIVLLVASNWATNTFAQTSCASPTVSVMAQWDFNSHNYQCNGATANPGGLPEPSFQCNQYTYCPNTNSGCPITILGSKGFLNTPNFKNALCLWNFYNSENTAGGAPYDPNSTSFSPTDPVNFYINYTIPAGKSGCLSSFALKILQRQFDGSTVNFEKQGVAVYRDGKRIFLEKQTILASNVNGTPMTFNFPSDPKFCSDGSQDVNFVIYFGLVHRLVAPGNHLSPAQTGYDDITINGYCGSGPVPEAVITQNTCGTTGPNSDGKITLLNFAATDKYDYTAGGTYSGSQTYATATTIPSGGVIVSNLVNNTDDQVLLYTVRIFTPTCYYDRTVSLLPKFCPGTVTCTQPSGAVLTPTIATCSGTSVNNDAQIAVTGVVDGTRIGISAGNTYSGPYYSGAYVLTGGAYTFTGLANPQATDEYTIRVYNGNDLCFKDYTVTLNTKDCGCKKALAEVCNSDAYDPDSRPNNRLSTEDDIAFRELCKSTSTIDLKLTKTVSPASGTTCPTNTDFTWTITLTNAGTMAATDIQVADILPVGLILTNSNASIGTYTLNSGWNISSLGASQSATLTLTTKATIAGTFQNCAEVMNAFPLNDPNSTPGNHITIEDDYACASITVTGSSTPNIVKEFSPSESKPNVPVRLTIKITNNEATPINLTAALVDNLPSSPSQLTIASTPNLNTSLTGVVATAGSTNITIPSGTVLLPGLNTIQVDVVGNAEGYYCNTIAAGVLKTSACDNLSETSACLSLNNNFNIPPTIKKSFSPTIVQAGQNSTLTITIENKDAQNFTLSQDFIDLLPSGLILAGTATGTCSGISTFSSTNQVGLTSGSIITPGSCTITVPVKSATAGSYCNTIGMNYLLGSIGTNNNIGNQDVAEACVTVTSTPCTTISAATVTPATSTVAPGATLTLTGSATGTSASTLYTWSSSLGSFSGTGINPTQWTAQMAPGTYTVNLALDNKLTGYGTCTANATAQITVSGVQCTTKKCGTVTVVKN